MNQYFEDLSGLKLPSTVIEELANRAKALRKTRGFSQAELAKRSGVSLGSLKRFEQTGQISLESLLMLAFTLKALDPFDELFKEDFQPKSFEELVNMK